MQNSNNNFLLMNPMNINNPPLNQINQINMFNNFQNSINQIPNLIGSNQIMINNNRTNQTMEIDNQNNNLKLDKGNNNCIKLGNECNHILKNELNDSEYYLYRFFKLIEYDSEKNIAKILYNKNLEKESQNRKVIKIYTNYYNLIRSEIYVDLDQPINDLKIKIFEQIFCPRLKNITSNCLFKYLDILFLEFKNINILTLSGKTGKELGLKEGDELSLKLCQELYNEIYSFPKDTSIILRVNGNIIGNFIPKKGGLSKNFLKIFNEDYYHLDSSLDSKQIINPGYTINFMTKRDVLA